MDQVSQQVLVNLAKIQNPRKAKNLVKVCWQAIQISLQFDEFFDKIQNSNFAHF